MQTETADLIVAGAGIAGLSVAYEAARRGARVVVLERDSMGCGATGASAGVIYPLEALPQGSSFDGLVDEALRSYPGFVDGLGELAGMDCGYRRPGLLDLEPEDERVWLPTAAPEASGFVPDGASGRWLPAAGRVEPEWLLKALAAGVVALGGTIVENVGPVALAGMPGEVKTGAGRRVTAANVVVATGAWTCDWSRHSRRAAEVRPVRGQMLRLRPKTPYAGPMIRDGEFYLAPTPDGDVICGSTVEDVDFDVRPTADGLTQILAHGLRALVAVGPYEVVYQWAGLRPSMLEDASPLLGEDDVHPWLHWATGYYRLGMTIAPVAACRVVDGLN